MKLGTKLVTLLVAVLAVGLAAWYLLFREVEQQFASPEESFKYGSIGAERDNGLPYWIWLLLPRMFPEYLPGPGGYASLGLHTEPGRETPVGFSVKTIGFKRVGINCAICHSETIRLSAGESAILYPAGPATTFDALGYQRFLFRCASDPRFNARNFLAEIAKNYDLAVTDKVLYTFLTPVVRKALLKQRDLYAWTQTRPYWGRGRIDPFNPVKATVLDVPVGDTTGNSDMVPIWNLAVRKGMALHWDGLNTDLTEVVRSSAIGDGATPSSIPLQHLADLQAWLSDLKPPAWPAARFPIDATLAAAGRPLFEQKCAGCHTPGGSNTGQVMPAAAVGTDPERAGIWTRQAADAYNAYAGKYDWGFHKFRSTGGYVAVPLDAIWTRAPYLHNGSVPTLHDLLEPVANRPKQFYRGYDVIDPVKVGFVSDGPDARRTGTPYDTTERGNSNQGHLWGTELSPQDKTALIEFMKTL